MFVPLFGGQVLGKRASFGADGVCMPHVDWIPLSFCTRDTTLVGYEDFLGKKTNDYTTEVAEPLQSSGIRP